MKRNAALIDVIVRQRKRVADEGDFGRVPAGGEDFDDVEAEADIGKVEQSQPGHGTFGHATLFVVIDRVGRSSAFLAGACFHFDKNEGVLRFVAADKIDFAPAGWNEVSVKDAESVAPEIFLGLMLAPLSKDDVVRKRLGTRVAFAPPAEKSGDGRGRGHVCGGLRGAPAHHSLCGGQNHTADIARRVRPSGGRGSLWR